MSAAEAGRADTDAPQYLSSGELYRRAHRIETIARIIMDCTASGSRCADSGRAERLMKEIGAIAGNKETRE